MSSESKNQDAPNMRELFERPAGHIHIAGNSASGKSHTILASFHHFDQSEPPFICIDPHRLEVANLVFKEDLNNG